MSAFIVVKCGVIGDQDQVDPGVERRDAGCGDAGLLP
jgi:hypothetical protein